MLRSLSAQNSALSPGYNALRRGRASEPGRAYLLTTVALRRSTVFLNPRAAASAARCFEDPALLATNRMLAWVLMPDHAHFLLVLGDGQSLAQSMARLKSASARRVNAVIARSGTLWEHGYHDRAVRSETQLEATARYLVANSVRAGLVEDIDDYPWWNSIWR